MPSSLYDSEITEVFKQASPQHTSNDQPLTPTERVSIAKPFPSPTDWRDHWIYFLMIDRFCNPTAGPAQTWDKRTTRRQGGSFNGVRQQLDYLKNLGVGAIWLSPVLKNPQTDATITHHGYGIMDFLEVDPRFGSRPEMAEQELISLVDEAHDRGMYVILDVVINHTGDLFAYDDGESVKGKVKWQDGPCDIQWRNESGAPRPDLRKLPSAEVLGRNEGIWPSDFQNNDWFRRRGINDDKQDHIRGDFDVLKEFITERSDDYGDKPVWNRLIRAHQYLIAKFGFDGFRVDTLKHVEREFALCFCNAIREYALSIHKNNFFIYGEINTNKEEEIAAYTGRYTTDSHEKVGADAALDFPLKNKLKSVTKGFEPPTGVIDVFNTRREIHRTKHLLSTHGEASRFLSRS